MRVLVVYNFEGCRLGQIGRALEGAGATVDLVRAYLGEPLPPTPEGYDGMLVLGGVQNALADEASPWLADLVALTRGFVDSGRAFLGICLGAQLLARAYGGANIIGGASEFGWTRIELTASGTGSPLFAGLPPSFPSFHWHDDTFTLPEGAELLATNEAVPTQAFRVGRAGYGVQFHFEADRQVVKEWSEKYAGPLAKIQLDWSVRHPVDAERLGPASEDASAMIARNWVGMIGTGA